MHIMKKYVHGLQYCCIKIIYDLIHFSEMFSSTFVLSISMTPTSTVCSECGNNCCYL